VAGAVEIRTVAPNKTRLDTDEENRGHSGRSLARSVSRDTGRRVVPERRERAFEGKAAPRKFSLSAASIDQGEAAVAGGDPVRWRRLVVARYPPLPNARGEKGSRAAILSAELVRVVVSAEFGSRPLERHASQAETRSSR
jgi:hypothetical protein